MLSNKNGKYAKLGTIVTICATIVATTLSILSFIRESNDKEARAEVNKARSGYAEHSKTIENMSKDIRSNREWILVLFRNNNPNRDSVGGGSTPPPRVRRPRIAPPKMDMPRMREQRKWRTLPSIKRKN
jgi:hypothetical protein